MLIHEASEKNGILSMDMVKKVAKHILLALQTLHDDYGIIHTDIKPANIATCVSKGTWKLQLKNVVESKQSLDKLRMSCKPTSDFNEEDARGRLKHALDCLPSTITDKPKPPVFKLIDFGNASVCPSVIFKISARMKEGYKIIVICWVVRLNCDR